MASLRRNRKQKKQKAASGGGGAAGLLAIATAALLFLRKRRKAKQAGVFPTQPEVVTAQGGETGLDDVTLARKVETEIFRDENVPKGAVVVNSEFGVVYLRGQVDSDEQIDALGTAARGVEGVKDVKNLLHTPGSPAPTAA